MECSNACTSTIDIETHGWVERRDTPSHTNPHLGEDFIIHHINFGVCLPEGKAAVGSTNVCCEKHISLLLNIGSLCEQEQAMVLNC